MAPVPRLGRLDAAIAAVFAMFWAAFATLSWQKWALLTADSARELYVPFQILHGAVIYQDFYYLYGPLAPYLNAGLLAVFGERLEVLYMAGLANTACVMALLYLVARQVMGAWPSAAVLFVFVSHFALGRDLAGYVWPYAFAATYSVTLGLLLVLALIRHARSGKLAWLALAGVAIGLTAVTKLEYGFAAVALGGAYGLARLALRRHLEAKGPWWHEAGALGLGAALTALPVVAAVLARMPLSTVLESVWPVELMALWSSTGMWHGSVASWAMNLKWLAFELALLALVVGHRRLGALVAAGGPGRFAVLAGLAAAGALAALSTDTLAFYARYGHMYWMSPGFLLLFAVIAGAIWRIASAVRAGKPIGPAAVAWLVIAGYGCLVAARTLMHGYNDYTRYQAPVVLVAWVAAFALWAPALASRLGWLTPGARSAPLLLAAVMAVVGGRHLADHAAGYSQPHVAVTSPVGTVLAEPRYGEPFNKALGFLKARLQPGEAIVAAPMEASFYLFTGRENVLKEDQLFYGYLVSPESQHAAIARMRDRRVRYVVVSNYGAGGAMGLVFGESFMRELGAWLKADCSLVARFGGPDYELKIYETPFSRGRSGR